MKENQKEIIEDAKRQISNRVYSACVGFYKKLEGMQLIIGTGHPWHNIWLELQVNL
jgi:hypothetical protein